jgi:DNA polymerase
LADRLRLFARAGLQRVARPMPLPAAPAEGNPPSDEAVRPLPAEPPVTEVSEVVEVEPEVPVEPAPAVEKMPRKKKLPRMEVVGSADLLGAMEGPELTVEEKVKALGKIAKEVAQCKKCPHLAEARTKAVPGEGNPNAKIVFVGEAPGADEDRQGRPFVGRAGQLLTKIIEACGLKREDVFICNILKSRPPDNRTPLPTEVFNCMPYLHRQLEIIRPQFIVALGATPAQNLLETKDSIGRLRGKLFLYRGIKLMCTYHPAYLLRNPAEKVKVWEDMRRLMLEFGVEL